MTTIAHLGAFFVGAQHRCALAWHDLYFPTGYQLRVTIHVPFNFQLSTFNFQRPRP